MKKHGIRDEANEEAKRRFDNTKAGERLLRNLSEGYAKDGLWKLRKQKALEEMRKLRPDFEEPEEGLEKFLPTMPAPHNPFVLRWERKRLSELGSLSDAPGQDRLPGASEWFDYWDHGWPLSEGTSLRYVTPEEHVEILRRLKGNGLTLPGSEVANVGFTLAEILDRPEVRPQWLVEGLLREGGAAMIYAPSGVGKTWLATTLALLAAHGRGLEACGELLKAGPGEGVKVLVVDGEMLESDLRQRADFLIGSFGADKFDRATNDRIKYYHKTEQDHRATFLDLGRPEWLKTLAETVTEGGFKLVVLDNLSTLNPSLEDENSAAAWGPLNETIVALKHLRVAILLVHHTGKGATKGASYRGSSNLTTTLETGISLERVGEDLGGLGGDAKFKVVLEKHRNHGTPKVHLKVLTLGIAGWQVETDEFALTEQLVKAAKSLRYVNQTELGEALGMDQPTVSRVLKKAIGLELCRREDFLGWLKKAKDIRENPEERPEVVLDI